MLFLWSVKTFPCVRGRSWQKLLGVLVDTSFWCLLMIPYELVSLWCPTMSVFPLPNNFPLPNYFLIPCKQQGNQWKNCFTGNKKVAAHFVVTLFLSFFWVPLKTLYQTSNLWKCFQHGWEDTVSCIWKKNWFPKTWKEDLMSHVLGIFWVGYQGRSYLLHTSHTGDMSCTFGRFPGWGFTGKEMPADQNLRLLQIKVCGWFWQWQTSWCGMDILSQRSSFFDLNFLIWRVTLP